MYGTYTSWGGWKGVDVKQIWQSHGVSEKGDLQILQILRHSMVAWVFHL